MGCVITFFTRALVMADMMSREGRARRGRYPVGPAPFRLEPHPLTKLKQKMVLDLTAPVRSAASMLRARTAL